MKHTKKIVALLLAVLMTMMLFSACSNDKGEKTPPKVTISSKDDLKGKKIAVQEGTTGDKIATAIEGVVVTRFKKATDTAMELNTGRIDAVIIDAIPAAKLVANNSGLKILDFAPADENEMYAIAIKKGNAELLSTVNAVIEEMKKDGSYDAVIARYVSGEDVEIPAIPAYTPNGKITMGTEATFEPFEYRNDANEIVGVDVEIAKKVAAKLGKELVIEDMAFDSLIAALSTGKVDFVAAGMTVDEERSQNADFSSGYWETEQAIIVKK